MFNQKHGIDELTKNIILEIISLYEPVRKTTKGRPASCSNNDYLTAIFYVLKTGICWSHFTYIVSGDAIRKKFIQWTNLGVFKKAWMLLIKIYEQLNLDLDDLFIDASHFKNMLGCEDIGRNHYDRFKKATKLSIITDAKGIPLSLSLNASNIHDSQMLDNLLQNMQVDPSKFTHLIADSGYMSADKEKQLYREHLLKYITQRRKNCKIQNTTYDNDRLRKRHIVENSFAWIKQYKRLQFRYEKKIDAFYSFVYLAVSNITSKRILNVRKVIRKDKKKDNVLKKH